jgi:hypothetical protein
VFLAILISGIVPIFAFCNCFAKVHIKEGKKEQNNETGEAMKAESKKLRRKELRNQG